MRAQEEQKDVDKLLDKVLSDCEETSEIIKTITKRIKEDDSTAPVKNEEADEPETDRVDS